MFSLLISASTETIIGSVAIVIIVISLGLIIATAVRNIMLQKKYGINNVYHEPPQQENKDKDGEEKMATEQIENVKIDGEEQVEAHNIDQDKIEQKEKEVDQEEEVL